MCHRSLRKVAAVTKTNDAQKTRMSGRDPSGERSKIYTSDGKRLDTRRRKSEFPK